MEVIFQLPVLGLFPKLIRYLWQSVSEFTQGSQPIWGFNYGAKKYDRVRQAYRYSVTACTVIATIFFFCFQIFPHQIVGIFGTGSELYFQFAERYLKIFMFMTFANGIQPVSSGFFYFYRYGEAGYCNVSDTTGDFSSAIDHYLPIVYGN